MIVNSAKTFFMPSLRYVNLFGFFKFRSNQKGDDLLNCAPKSVGILSDGSEEFIYFIYLFIYLFILTGVNSLCI